MESGRGFHAPRLTFRAFNLCQRITRQSGARINRVCGVDSTRFPPGSYAYKKKVLLVGVLVWACLNLDSIIEEDVCGEQDFFTAIKSISDVMKPPT